jgi:sodium/potassium-transporting ATPase subunit beta
MSSGHHTGDVDEAPPKNKCHAFLRGIYNPRLGTFCGRTGSSWAKIGTFYIIYYLCLAAFFCGMLSVLVHGMMSGEVPYLTGQNSLLADGPGVAIHPQFIDEVTKDVEATVIHVDGRQNSKLYERYKKATEKLLSEYDNTTSNSNVMNCNLQDNSRPERNIDKVCRFPLSELGPCAKPADNLKDTGIPCVYIRMNKIYGWLPDLTDNATTPMVKCVGQNPADIENLGELQYYPSVTYDGKQYGAISHAFFPFLRQEGYTDPLVAVTFPKIYKNVMILLKCHLIGLSSTAGDTAFELMVDA